MKNRIFAPLIKVSGPPITTAVMIVCMDRCNWGRSFNICRAHFTWSSSIHKKQNKTKHYTLHSRIACWSFKKQCWVPCNTTHNRKLSSKCICMERMKRVGMQQSKLLSASNSKSVKTPLEGTLFKKILLNVIVTHACKHQLNLRINFWQAWVVDLWHFSFLTPFQRGWLHAAVEVACLVVVYQARSTFTLVMYYAWST